MTHILWLLYDYTVRTCITSYTVSGYPILLQTHDKLWRHRGQQRADNLISTLHPRTNQCQPFHEPLLRLLGFRCELQSFLLKKITKKCKAYRHSVVHYLLSWQFHFKSFQITSCAPKTGQPARVGLSGQFLVPRGLNNCLKTFLGLTTPSALNVKRVFLHPGGR